MHIQGGAALQGERTLWRLTKKKADVNFSGCSQGASSTSAPSSSRPGGAHVGGNAPKPTAIGPHNPLRQTLSKALTSLAHGGNNNGNVKINGNHNGFSKAGGGSTVEDGASLDERKSVADLVHPAEVRGGHQPPVCRSMSVRFSACSLHVNCLFSI